MRLEHPLRNIPSAGEVVDGHGVHQFKAQDVLSIIEAKAIVEDWTFGVGCLVVI